MRNRILIAVLCLTVTPAVQAQQSSTPATMYVERNVFHLKFGASKEAVPMWKNYLMEVQKRDPEIHARLLTDVSGQAYTLILELTYASFPEMEPSECRLTNQPDWREFYQKFIPLCEKAERTYYKLQTEF